MAPTLVSPLRHANRHADCRAIRKANRRTGLLFAALSAFAVWRQRRALASLDRQMLNDIGLTRAEADAESRRPVWDVPQGWLR